MSRRYIDADKLAKTYMLKGKDKLRLATVINELELAPTADVVEVKHGEWIEHSYGELKCSACRIVQEDEPHRYNYCPCCGAKMDGERREQNEG